MTAREAGFINRCKQRGVDPQAVVKFASEYAAGRRAAREQFEKTAAAINEALAGMTPYQRGFALRCTQRGVSAVKVAEFINKTKNR